MEFSRDVIEKVGQLHLQARRRVSALLTGDYRSAFRGSGMQFKEFRHYAPGDDIRHMSWPVTARTGRATLKVFEEERELQVCLLVDVSGSSLFGSSGRRKVDMYAELLALLGLAAVKSRDKVSVLFFHDQPGEYLPPRNTQTHVLRAVTRLLGHPLRGSRSDLRPALAYALNVMKQRGLVIVISDFLVPEFERELSAIARRHELVLLHCFDDAERGSGLEGVFEAWDPETGGYYLLDAGTQGLRHDLARAHVLQQSGLEETCRSCRADLLNLSVQDDYLQRLVQFFRRRGPARL